MPNRICASKKTNTPHLSCVASNIGMNVLETPVRMEMASSLGGAKSFPQYLPLCH